MLKSLTIRKKLVLSILIGCLIPYIFGAFYIKSVTEDWLYKNNLEYSNRFLHQTAKQVDESILNNMKNLVSMIALDAHILDVTSDINSYVDYDQIGRASCRERV